MAKSKKYFIESLWENLLRFSGSITSVVILLIVLFLFYEGGGLFKKNKVEEGYSLVVNQDNPVDASKLTVDQVKDIFDYEITSWQQLGVTVADDDIMLFRLDDIESYVESEEELSDERISSTLNRIVQEHPGMIAFIPEMYTAQDFSQRILDLGTLEFGEVFGGEAWFPTAHPAPLFGLLPIILGTLWVSFGAILIALPFGIGAAIYLAELSNRRTYRYLKQMIELLAGIPSVVFGFFGLVVIVPLIQKLFNLPVGESGLAGSIILAIMALPTIITIAEDAICATPRAMKEASLALGATQWQTIYKVTLPYAASGISAGVVLGIGRAIGETMAVLMVTGNSAVIPNTLLEPLRTIPATIAAELGEAPKGGAHYEALFLLGCILFIMTLVINLSVEYLPIFRKNRMK